MLIDCQNHVFPREYVELLGRNPHPTRAAELGDGAFAIRFETQEFRVTHAMYDPQQKLRDMDRCRIDVALLSINMPGPCMLADDLAVGGARLINDYIADLTRRHPDRFAGLASIPWQLPDEAIREMDRAADEQGLRGVVLYSHVRGRPVDDPAFGPVYAHAEAKGLPIVFHPTVPAWGAAIKDHWMIPMMGLQVDTSFALLRLILAGVLERHPRLQVVMPHVGGVLPYMMGRIDNQTEVMGRGREHITRPPSSYLRDVYLDTVTPSAQSLRFAYEFSGAGKLLFATDHPWVDSKLFVDLLNGLEASAEEKAQIGSANAAALFRIA